MRIDCLVAATAGISNHACLLDSWTNIRLFLVMLMFLFGFLLGGVFQTVVFWCGFAGATQSVWLSSGLVGQSRFRILLFGYSFCSQVRAVRVSMFAWAYAPIRLLCFSANRLMQFCIAIARGGSQCQRFVWNVACVALCVFCIVLVVVVLPRQF